MTFQFDPRYFGSGDPSSPDTNLLLSGSTDLGCGDWANWDSGSPTILGTGIGDEILGPGLPHDTYFAHVYIIIYIIIYIYVIPSGSRIWQWKIRTINHLFIDD